MATAIEVLASYIPAMLRRRLARADSTTPLLGQETHHAAVLFADISGFTRLSERLCDRGPDGLEELTEALNAYFDRLIELIASHGGDVVKMAGDALIAVWPTEVLGETIELATVRAARCGLAMQETLQDYEVGEGIRLSSKVAIAAGDVTILHVGGAFDRWEMLLCGPPLVEMGHAEKLAESGDVIVGPEAWAVTRETLTGIPFEGGFLRLTAVKMVPIPFVLDSPIPSDTAENALRAYVPGAIRESLAAGQTEWLAELRLLTVLFVKFPPPDLGRPDVLEATQRFMTSLQTAIYRFEGSVNKLSIDEKGTTLVAAFGFPPLGHEDDAARAIAAAASIRESLNLLGIRCAIGVTTGRAYCGEVGNARRREYTMIGRVVNLAARLMQAAVPNDDIICDEATFRAARLRFHFDELPPISLKNIERPVVPYRPRGPIAPAAGIESSLGRDAERSVLSARLDRLHEGQGGLVFIEGDAGIGKSRLVADLVELAKARGTQILVGAGDAIERSTPYHAWRVLIAEILEVDENVGFEEKTARVVARLVSNAELLRLSPLLNDILALDLPESALIGQMVGQVRADNTNALLLGILGQAAGLGPTVIILEDAHWFDSSSWALTHQLIRMLPGVLILITARPYMTAFPGESLKLLQVLGVSHLRLDSLDTQATLNLACRRLGVESLPEPVATLILQKSQGNPFFCEELAAALQDANLLLIENGRCQVAPGVDLNDAGIPNHVEGVVNGRIARLSPTQKLTLKVASIIGRLFGVRLLHDVYPIEPDRIRLPDQLESLSGLELIELDEPEIEPAYLFRHVITRDVVYDLMPSAQRKMIHRAIAEWYERTRGDEMSPSFYPLLAYHWSRAHDDVKAIDYLQQAAEHALRSGAYQEAVGFFDEAFRLNGRLNPGAAPHRVAAWDYGLGEAHLSLGNLAKSRYHAVRTLKSLGQDVPSLAHLPLAYLTQIARQFARRMSPTTRSARSPCETSRLASAAFGLIGQVCYFEQDRAFGIYAAIRALNLAERDGGPSVELARSLAVMCMACGLVPLHRLAESYGQRAFATAAKLDDVATRAWVLQLTGMYYLGVCRWAESRENLGQAVNLSRQIGDWRRWEESSGELARLEYYLGAFECGAERFKEFGEVARRQGHVQATVWSLNGRAKNLLRLGRIDEAHALLQESRNMPAEGIGVGDAILRDGLLAHVYRLEGYWKAAREAADETSRLIGLSPPIVSYTLEGYSGAAEAYLALWENGEGGPQVAAAAWRAVSALRKMARVFPVGRPRARLCHGLARWLSGNRRLARLAWNQALESAESLGLPFERGLALYEIGRHLDPSDPARLDYLSRATSLFDEAAATGESQRCRVAARSPGPSVLPPNVSSPGLVEQEQH
jgi:class 3 adenylate cyclase/tetratricopeptide (TPR) repeat protein